MKIKTMTLSDVLEEFTTITTQFDFKGTYTDTEGTTHQVTVFDTNYFLMEVLHNFTDRKIRIDSEHVDTDFLHIFQYWKASRENLYLKQAYAYTLAYNPIENYSSVETHNLAHTFEHGEKIELEGGITNTNTATNRTNKHEYSQDRKDTTTSSRYGVNSSNPVPADKVEDTKAGYEQDTENGVITDTRSGKDTTTHSGTDTERDSGTLTKRGNIGVMTPAEMLQKEYDALSQDLARRALYDFLTQYTFYAEVEA